MLFLASDGPRCAPLPVVAPFASAEVDTLAISPSLPSPRVGQTFPRGSSLDRPALSNLAVSSIFSRFSNSAFVALTDKRLDRIEQRSPHRYNDLDGYVGECEHRAGYFVWRVCLWKAGTITRIEVWPVFE